MSDCNVEGAYLHPFVHAFLHLGGIRTLQEAFDGLPQARQCLLLGVPLADDFELDTFGDEAALFRPDPCGQLHGTKSTPAQPEWRGHWKEGGAASAELDAEGMR